MSFDVTEWRARMLLAVSHYGQMCMEHAYAIQGGPGELAPQVAALTGEARMQAYRAVIDMAHEVPYSLHSSKGGA